MPPAITIILFVVAVYLATGLLGKKFSKWLYDEFTNAKTKPGFFKEIIFILSGPLILSLEILFAVFCLLAVFFLIGAFTLGYGSFSLTKRFLDPPP